MRFTVILILSVCLALPAFAGGRHHHDRHHDHGDGIHISDGTGLDIEGDVLIISHEGRRRDEEVRVSRDGELWIDGDSIPVDPADRKLLRVFYAEVEKLEEMADEIGDEAGEISAASTAFAARTVARVLRALGDEDAPRAKHADYDDDDFEEKIEAITEFAERIGDQAEKISDLAEELKDEIPELRDLDWFLDD